MIRNNSNNFSVDGSIPRKKWTVHFIHIMGYAHDAVYKIIITVIP